MRNLPNLRPLGWLHLHYRHRPKRRRHSCCPGLRRSIRFRLWLAAGKHLPCHATFGCLPLLLQRRCQLWMWTRYWSLSRSGWYLHRPSKPLQVHWLSLLLSDVGASPLARPRKSHARVLIARALRLPVEPIVSSSQSQKITYQIILNRQNVSLQITIFSTSTRFRFRETS